MQLDAWNQTDRDATAVAQQTSVLATLVENPDHMTTSSKASAVSFASELLVYLDPADSASVTSILDTLGMS